MPRDSLPFDDLPGGDLARQGLADLERGVESVESLLVMIGAPKLRELGLDVPWVTDPLPEHRLYRLLAQTEGDAAHGAYNALIRRLVSFERAATRFSRQALGAQAVNESSTAGFHIIS